MHTNESTTLQCLLSRRLAVALTICAGTADAHPQCEQRLAPAELESLDDFGYAIDVDRGVLAVGARGDDDQAEAAGAVYIYDRGSHGWDPSVKLFASDGLAQDHFGHAVALEGDRLIVSAARADAQGNSEAGRCYVFERQPSGWVETGRLEAGSPVTNAFLGSSISLSGDLALAGAPDPYGQGAGAAYVFEKRGSDWIERAKLVAPDGVDGDQFGASVSLDGDLAVIGAPVDSDVACGSGRGAVYVFRRGGASWLLEQKVIPPGCAQDGFGQSVSTDGGRILVGDYLDNNVAGYDAGSAHFFAFDGVRWTQTDLVIPSDLEASDWFGIAVRLEDSRAVIGTRFGNGRTPHTGAAYLYELIDSSWMERRKFFASDGEFDDRFGMSLALDEEFVLIAAPRDGEPEWSAGSLYAYDLESCNSLCAGDGSGQTACPCGNESQSAGVGCTCSQQVGGALAGFGSTDAGSDDLHFATVHLPTGQMAILFVGDLALRGGHGTTFGDGLRCVGGPVVRLGTHPTNLYGTATWGGGLSALGGWYPGIVKYFQVWYRDPAGPCGSGFNLTNAVRVAFSP